MKKTEQLSKFNRAKRRVEKLKSFYTHLGIYIAINVIILGFKLSGHLNSWDIFMNKISSFDALFTPSIWGIVLLIHASSVFLFPKLFGYDWEERQIEKLMQEELNSKK